MSFLKNCFSHFFLLCGILVLIYFVAFWKPLEHLRPKTPAIDYQVGNVVSLKKIISCGGLRNIEPKCFEVVTDQGYIFHVKPELFQVGDAAKVRYGYARTFTSWEFCAGEKCAGVGSGNQKTKDLFEGLVKLINHTYAEINSHENDEISSEPPLQWMLFAGNFWCKTSPTPSGDNRVTFVPVADASGRLDCRVSKPAGNQ